VAITTDEVGADNAYGFAAKATSDVVVEAIVVA
jgi:hypothetical protein